MIFSLDRFDYDVNSSGGPFGYILDDRCKPFREKLQEELFRVSSDNVSYRTMNHWESLNLVSSKRKGERGWRRFSCVEIVWIEMILSMRKFGLALERIEAIKNKLELEQRGKKDYGKLPYLEYILFRILNENKPFYLLVTHDDCIFEDDDEFEVLCRANSFLGVTESFIVVPINPLLKKYIAYDYFGEYKQKQSVKSREAKVLEELRSGQNASVNITLTANGIQHVRSKRRKDVQTSIADLSRSEKDQDIVIKIRNGKKVGIDQEIIKTEKKHDNS